jgi:formylglycine-generating enzyme required for sulfatase activity
VAKAGIGHTSAVGLFPSGDTACELGNQKGLADLAGNVAEWCRTVGLDRYEDYEENVRDELEAEGARVSRGGAWDYYLVYLAPSFRECHLPAERDCYAGFRVVCAGASVQ